MHVINVVTRMKIVIQLLAMMLASPLYADNLHLDINSLHGGRLSDGVKLARGKLICPESHSIFHVWMNARIGKNTDNYIIYGKIPGNEIHVRIEGEGWLSDKDKHGIIKSSSEYSAMFSVVSNGNQVAPVDEYVLSVSGICN